jgi:hypothetical protein
MKQFFLQCLALISLLGMNQSVYAAAGQDRGGGLAYSCSFISAQPVVHLVDLYQVLNGTKFNFLRLFNDQLSNEESVEQAILSTIKETDPEMADQLKTNLEKLQFIPVKHLDLVGDDDLTDKDIPSFCSKVQLAVQVLDEGIVNYDAFLYSKLTPVEQAFLKLHEAYIRIFHANTHAVRDKVAGVAGNSTFLEYLLSQISETHLSNLPFCADNQVLNLDDKIAGTYKRNYRNGPVLPAVTLDRRGFKTLPTSLFMSRVDYFRYDRASEALLNQGYCIKNSLEQVDQSVWAVKVVLKRHFWFPDASGDAGFETILRLNRSTGKYEIHYFYGQFEGGRSGFFFPGWRIPWDRTEDKYVELVKTN